MQAVLERVLSGRNACCSYVVTWNFLRQPQQGTSVMARPRGAAMVTAAAGQPRPPKGSAKNSKVSGPEAKGNQGKAKGRQQGKRPGSSMGSVQSTKPKLSSMADMKAAAPKPAAAATKVPTPSASTAASTPTMPVGKNSKGLNAAAARPKVPTLEPVPGRDNAEHGQVPHKKVTPAELSRKKPGADFLADQGSNSDNDDDDDDDDGFMVDDLDSSEAAGSEADHYDMTADAGDTDTEEEAFPQIQLDLPNPTNVKVKTAEYLQSCVAVSGCPAPRFPEFAVIGRSNVGKSSLINMLTGRKDLALVSKEPGKTKCINHFLINGSWYFVDLPGYGYAKIGIQGRQQFDAFTREYFKARSNLAMVFLLVDASIPPQKIDLEYAIWLTDNEVPFTLVFTKADKRRKGVPKSARDSHVTAFKRSLLQDLAFLPPAILTSSAKGIGRGEMLNFIAGLRIAFEKSGRLAAIRQGML